MALTMTSIISAHWDFFSVPFQPDGPDYREALSF